MYHISLHTFRNLDQMAELPLGEILSRLTAIGQIAAVEPGSGPSIAEVEPISSATVQKYVDCLQETKTLVLDAASKEEAYWLVYNGIYFRDACRSWLIVVRECNCISSLPAVGLLRICKGGNHIQR